MLLLLLCGGDYLLGLQAAVVEELFALDAGVGYDLLGHGFRGEYRVADLLLAAAERFELLAQVPVFFFQTQRLLANILQHGVDLVGVIIFFLDDVDIDVVKIFLIESHFYLLAFGVL